MAGATSLGGRNVLVELGLGGVCLLDLFEEVVFASGARLCTDPLKAEKSTSYPNFSRYCASASSVSTAAFSGAMNRAISDKTDFTKSGTGSNQSATKRLFAKDFKIALEISLSGSRKTCPEKSRHPLG
ncbi:hypothetical protein [Roseovarius tolerans]|uniref:hypothetical protein n=1 Tax=Roseovarius tolerans TaxID=74031 RepID=UPI000ADB8C28|nr:hypothetical protein [Roseovarius tolerans]